MKRFFTFLLTVALFAFGSVTNAAPIKILIIDGQNNHNWKAMSPFMKAQLEKTGRFTVDISTTPSTTPNAPKSLTAEQKAKAEQANAELKKEASSNWDAWRPDFAKYDVIISHYNGQDWPQPVKTAFESHMKNGGRFVCVHAADNSFPNWLEYNQMIGLGGWGGRTEKHGPYV